MLMVAATGVLSGCGLSDSGTEWKSGPFEVVWVDLVSNRHLAYRLSSSVTLEVVGACVIGVGANEKYISVERVTPNSSSTTYFVVSRTDYDPKAEKSAAVRGPFSRAEFDQTKQGLAVPEPREILPQTTCAQRSNSSFKPTPEGGAA